MRKIPGKLLPHRGLVVVEPYLGGGAQGRIYGNPVVIKRAFIDDDEKILRDQYDVETVLTGTVFFTRDELKTIPVPETRVMIWVGTPDERSAVVDSVARYHHPRIADLLEVKLR